MKAQSFDAVGLFARAAVVILVLASTSFARIGETETQLRQRYGDPKPFDPPELAHPRLKSYVYTKGEYTIVVVLLDGISHFERLTKQSGVSADEAEAILKVNVSRGYWLLKPTLDEKMDEEIEIKRQRALGIEQRKPLASLPPDRWKVRHEATWTREDLHMNKLLQDRYHGLAKWDGKLMVISTLELLEFYEAHSAASEAAEAEKKRAKEAAALKGF